MTSKAPIDQLIVCLHEYALRKRPNLLSQIENDITTLTLAVTPLIRPSRVSQTKTIQWQTLKTKNHQKGG